jgi:hypothetical protein
VEAPAWASSGFGAICPPTEGGPGYKDRALDAPSELASQPTAHGFDSTRIVLRPTELSSNAASISQKNKPRRQADDVDLGSRK